MKDRFDREQNYLRISITDRCDLRCSYCMPRCAVKDIPHTEIHTFEEIARIVRVSASLGIKKVRITGGEPLVRKNTPELVKMLRGIDGIEELDMTTNGLLLSRYAGELRSAGIDRINISLDTTDRDIFQKITGTDGLDKVLHGIDTALGEKIKLAVNCVPVAGVNDDISDTALYALEKGIDIRFIELMPIGCAKGAAGVPSDEVLSRLINRFGEPVPEQPVTGSTAVYYRFRGFGSRVGFISPISHKFCKYCCRLRLTSDGFLKPCLQYPQGTDLKALIRSGCSDDELSEAVKAAVWNKPEAHSFSSGDLTDSRIMSHIGG